MNRSSITSYLIPRIRDILFLIMFTAAMAAGYRSLNMDGDLPRHLLMGRVILETGSVPSQEIFSYVYEGRPYVAHEWLADVIYYLFYATLGLQGVVLLTAILIAATFTALYSALSSEYEERLLMLFLVIWGAAITFLHWIARPHLFSMLFLAIWLTLIDRISRGRRVNIWILPAIMVLWGNIHAEFIAGFLVLIAYTAGWFWDYLFYNQDIDREVIKKLAGGFFLSLLASLINPFGVQTWGTVFSYLGNRFLMSTISETRPPDFSNPYFFVLFFLIILSILILSLKKGKFPSGKAFLIAGFTALALISRRNVHLYGIVAPFAIAGAIIEITDSALQKRITAAVSQTEKQLKGFVWPVATILIYFVLIVTGKFGQSYFFDPKYFPVDAVKWLENNPQPGRMFNDFKWGGYILWHLWPEQKVFIDSQTDITGEATRVYGTVEMLSEGWQDVLDQYQVRWVIMPVGSPLGQQLVKDGWRMVYTDTTAIILRRK